MDEKNLTKTSTKGGARPGAGRKKGGTNKTKTPRTETFYRKVTPEEFEALDKFLNDLRS